MKEDSAVFTADHHGFYHRGTPFFPWVQEEPFPLLGGSNAALLPLPASLNDNLDWSKEKELAQHIILSGKSILWEIDFGLSHFQFTPENTAAFFSFSLAIEEFTKMIWPSFQDQTFGVALYRGNPPSQNNFPKEHWESPFSEWQNSSDYDLYCIQMLSEYLHRLVSFLPDSVMPFALFDLTSIQSSAKTAQFFSKERFEHLHLILKGAQSPFIGVCWEHGQQAQGLLSKAPTSVEPCSSASVGIYLPKDPEIDSHISKELEMLMARLIQTQTVFRVIPEEKLTEQWDGIDELIIPSHTLSARGRRKLLGFIAAGGRVLSPQGTEIIIS